MNQVCLKVIPAIAAGCTMVLKPSEIAPLSSIDDSGAISEGLRTIVQPAAMAGITFKQT